MTKQLSMHLQHSHSFLYIARLKIVDGILQRPIEEWECAASAVDIFERRTISKAACYVVLKKNGIFINWNINWTT